MYTTSSCNKFHFLVRVKLMILFVTPSKPSRFQSGYYKDVYKDVYMLFVCIVQVVYFEKENKRESIVVAAVVLVCDVMRSLIIVPTYSRLPVMVNTLVVVVVVA